MPKFVSKNETKTGVFNRDMLPAEPTKEQWREAFSRTKSETGLENVKGKSGGEVLEGDSSPIAFKEGEFITIRTTRLCVFTVTDSEYTKAAAMWMAENARRDTESRAKYSRRRRQEVQDELFGELQDGDAGLDNYWPSMVVVSDEVAAA